MYIQITTRCNMSCGHCSMNCTEKGEDMPWGVFKAAVDMDPEAVTIGGGEPTLHPEFEKFLLYAIGQSEYVWMATNGSITDRALMLAKLAKKGVLAVALSLDRWHDPIDDKVVEAFTHGLRHTYRRSEEDRDLREIRDVGGKECKRGRCDFGRDQCACPGHVVRPDGRIYMCGCDDAPQIGNVFDGIDECHPGLGYDCVQELRADDQAEQEPEAIAM